MDLFGFDEDKILNNQIDNQIIVEMAIKKYRKSLISMLTVFGAIIIILNVILVPFYFNQRLEERVSQIDMTFARERHLPDNYTMIGVEVGAMTINSVIEIESSTPTVGGSAGSGFIISENGYIVSNAHVVTYEGTFSTKKHSNIIAKFYGSDESHLLQLIDYDTDLDIAILRFRTPPNNLSPVTIGDSDLLNLGEEIIAIGNAQGLGLALTTGVVSDPLKTFSDGIQAIQIDAAINPGNSGGPMFNVYAECVGMTTFKIVADVSNEGLGFAIPTNIIIDYINDVENSRRIEINYQVSEEE